MGSAIRQRVTDRTPPDDAGHGQRIRPDPAEAGPTFAVSERYRRHANGKVGYVLDITMIVSGRLTPEEHAAFRVRRDRLVRGCEETRAFIERLAIGEVCEGDGDGRAAGGG